MLRNDPHIGAPRNRVDGPATVTGAAKYAADFEAPNLAYGYVVSSAVARGRIAVVETTAAEAVRGRFACVNTFRTPGTASAAVVSTTAMRPRATALDTT